MAARAKARICCCSLAGITVSNPAGGMDVCLFVVSIVRCQVEVCAPSPTLVQGNPTECGVSECDSGISTKGSPRPNGAVEP
jgi:hypothetical protein